MKHLLLLRHAKSSRDDPTLRDFDRPLNDRGVNDTKLIGKFIHRKKVHADLVISSPAKRAQQTAELLMKAAGLKVQLRLDQRIYEAGPRQLLEVISQIEEAANAVVLVGHNPGFEDLCTALIDEKCAMPTAAVACIELGTSQWNRVRSGVGKLKWLVTPKQLKGD